MKCTTEDWLKAAVEQIDVDVFNGELGLDREFQIYYGRVRGRKGAEHVLPSDNEDITLEDFFPITIGIDYQIRDPKELMRVLALECMKAFFGVSKGKAFKQLCKQYYWEPPFTNPTPSDYLEQILGESLTKVEAKYGKFPGKAVKFPIKEKKKGKPNKAIFLCPECGMEFSASMKKLKDNQGTPTCICGAKTSRIYEDEEDNG